VESAAGFSSFGAHAATATSTAASTSFRICRSSECRSQPACLLALSQGVTAQQVKAALQIVKFWRISLNCSSSCNYI
jgi:hypothetical protein